MRNKTLAAFLFWSCGLAIAFAQEMPGRTAFHVNDHAGILSQTVRNELELSLKKLQREKPKVELIVTTFRSTEGRDLRDFVLEYIPKWRRPWPFERDRRVHFIVISEDQQLWIGIGNGIIQKFTLEMSNHIIEKNVKPELERGQYEQGLKNGVEQMVKMIKENV